MTPTEPGDEHVSDAIRRSRALAGPTRARLFALLESSGTALTSQQLAAEVGIHPTAARQHMEVLIGVGLVAKEIMPGSRRGRPSVAYRVAAEADPHEWLARALAAALAEGVSPRDMGRRLGAELSPQGEDPIAVLEEEARRVGFDPLVRRTGRDTEVLLQCCPFARTANEQPEVVCELHRGLAEGVMIRSGGGRSVELRVGAPCRLLVRGSH